MPEKKSAAIKPVKKSAVAKTAKPTKVEKVAKPAKKPIVKTPAAKAEKKVLPAKASIGKGDKYVPAMGKRKTAVASIRVHQDGVGSITVNGRTLNEYFNTAYQRKVVEQPLKQTNLKNLDFSILVKGGGKTGQADACRLGIAKILIKLDPELRPQMRALGWVTRDSRRKERKKPGLKRARRSPQWSKR